MRTAPAQLSHVRRDNKGPIDVNHKAISRCTPLTFGPGMLRKIPTVALLGWSN